MIDETHTVTISRPVKEVFDFVANPLNEPAWHFDVKEVSRPKEGPYELGETFQWVVKFGGSKTYSLEVTGLEPNRFIEITTREGSVLPVLTHTFQQDGDSTRYTRRVRFETRGLLRVMAPVMKRMRNPNTRWAENLKELLES
ncbi:MAG TPA: SRPBCC family protein [Acidimicrobiia bacterium]|nr:SRPBCC family protein [Acidimicrobiia bacterium]